MQRRLSPQIQISSQGTGKTDPMPSKEMQQSSLLKQLYRSSCSDIMERKNFETKKIYMNFYMLSQLREVGYMQFESRERM
jgi:hypothetical protein